MVLPGAARLDDGVAGTAEEEEAAGQKLLYHSQYALSAAGGQPL